MFACLLNNLKYCFLLLINSLIKLLLIWRKTMDQLEVLNDLKDINPQKLAEVENLLATGALDACDSKQVSKKANEYFVELNFASASRIFRHFFQKFADDAEFLYSFGYLTYECGFMALAEQMLQRSITLAPDAQFRKYFILGDMYKVPQPKIALQLFEKGILLAEKEEAEMSKDLTTEGVETERGRKIYNKLTDNDRTISQAYCAVAEILMNQPQFPKNRKNIEAALKKAQEQDPEYLEPCYQRCFLYFNLSDEQSCRKEITKFVAGVKEIEKVNDEDLLDYPAEMLVAIVRMMIEGEIWEDGAYLAEIAATNDHQNYEACYMLAFCALNMDDFDTCKENLARLVTFDLEADQEIKEAIAELREEYKERLKNAPPEMIEEGVSKQKGEKRISDMENEVGMEEDDWLDDDFGDDDEEGGMDEEH
jgi:tetratricopeptide (TPR) repeat protein